jgi:DNA-binding MarR family transcriptional regulator
LDRIHILTLDRISQVNDRARDEVDDILRDWEGERPDLDMSPIGVMGRLSHLGRLVDRFYAASAGSFDLSASDFFVLAELRRAGDPYQLSPSQLSRTLIRSSGGMTKQLDSLENAGLVRRSPDPSDRRGVTVTLTATGIKRINAALTAHIQSEHRLLAGLTPTQRTRLVSTLRQVAHALESQPGLPSDEPGGSEPDPTR